MSFTGYNADPFAEEEVVTTDKVQAAQIHLKSVPTDPAASVVWGDSGATTSYDPFEAPFHIHHTDEPSFKPMVTQESPKPVAPTPQAVVQPVEEPAAPAAVDVFDYPLTKPVREQAKPQSPVEAVGARPRASISPRVTVGGVPLGVDSLLKAVKAKNIESTSSLLKQGMNPNAQNEENQTALHLAVLVQSPEIVRLLLDCPFLDPNMVDIAYNTPLHIASCHCDAPVRCSPDLSELVPAPSPAPASSSSSSSSSGTMLVPASTVNDSTGENDTPLEAIIRMLCTDTRVDVNMRNTSLHVPLIYSCLNGNYKVAALLVKAGASVNAATHTDIYPLHSACENGYADIVRLLLLNGALVNVRDYQGYTPLHLAARGNFGAICGLLWRHRADINAVTLPTSSNQVGKRPCDLATDMEIKNFLSGMKTSSSHPLEVNFVTHQVLGKCRIGMTMCPGRNKKDHRRNLTMDVAALLQVGTQVLVTLVQQHELDSMKIPDMMTRVRAAGIEVIHAPIKDKWIPSRVGILVELVDLIVERVKLGKTITVHCNGGKGRTGLVVAGTLVALGMEPGPATDLIRTARPGMLYNPAQIVYLRLYQRTINGREAPTGALTSIPTELAVFEAHKGTDDDDGCGVGHSAGAHSSTSPCGNRSSYTDASMAGDVGSSHADDEQLVVMSPATQSQTNLADIQFNANRQEHTEQPDLPIGEQKPYIVGTLIEDDPMPAPLDSLQISYSATPTQQSQNTNPFL